MTYDLVLVSCCGPKAKRATAAELLYQSPLFVAASRWAQDNGKQWAILSARHGIVDPCDVIAPYDCELSKLPPDQLRRWGHLCQPYLAEYIRDHRTCIGRDSHGFRRWKYNVAIAVLAGRTYCDALRATTCLQTIGFEEPLAGLQIGERLAWLNSRNVRTTPTPQLLF